MDLKDKINFTVWCDFIERDFLENEFQNMLRSNIIHGATSNPSIFSQSIMNCDTYNTQRSMLKANNAKKIYEELAITDIKRAAQILFPLYEKNHTDGFISIEVDPTLCNNTDATVDEGIRLFKSIGYENVMVKVPATDAGYKAIKILTSKDININATLVFSPKQAFKCAQALDEGIKLSQTSPKSVISIFVSRFDRLCNDQFASVGLETYKLGIINATKCYNNILKFKNENIRTLFASTGVKGNDVKKSYYIDNLIYPNTVNTAPLDAINAWKNNGHHKQSVLINDDLCDEFFNQCNVKNINLEKIYESLLKDGLNLFKVSFDKLLKEIKE